MSNSSDESQKSKKPLLKSQSSSSRKQLPSIPDSDTQMTLANKMIDKSTSSPRGCHSYSPFFLEYSILAEYNQTQKACPPGVYVLPFHSSPLLWHGVIFVRQGVYEEGVFRFTLTIPEMFPDGDCPKVTFHPPIFHPLIDSETGELDVKRVFPKWRRNINHIYQILVYTRRVFHKIDTHSPLNKEAAHLYNHDQTSFRKRVAETVQTSKDQLYEAPPNADDAHAIRFSPWDESVHEDVRQQVLHPQKTNNDKENKSLSWMKPGSAQIFSRKESATA